MLQIYLIPAGCLSEPTAGSQAANGDLIFLTKYLLLCEESIKDAQKYVPEFLNIIIKKNLSCINFIKNMKIVQILNKFA